MSSSQQCSSSSPSLTVVQIPCLDDNYGYLIHDRSTGATAAVDTPDSRPYETELSKRGWKLTHILNTHQYVMRAAPATAYDLKLLFYGMQAILL